MTRPLLLVPLSLLLLAGSGLAAPPKPRPGKRPAPSSVVRPHPVTSLAFSPDGSTLAVGGYREVRLLEARSGQLQARFDTPAGMVNSVAFSPDGTLLAAGGGRPGKEGEILLWERRTGRPLPPIHAHRDAIYGIAFSPNGLLLAAASYDHLVSLHPVGPGQPESAPRMLKDHTDSVYCVAFSPDGARLASAAGDRTVKVWDVASGRRLYTLSEAAAELYAVAYRPDGKQIAAGGVDKMLRVWDVTPTAGRLEQSAFAHDGAIIRLGYTADGRTLATTGEDRIVKAWDAEALTERYHLEKQPDWAPALALTADGARLAVGC